jgi:HD-GYP domain-containing protein (c-di-GMP phosphodiesterase class II)
LVEQASQLMNQSRALGRPARKINFPGNSGLPLHSSDLTVGFQNNQPIEELERRIKELEFQNTIEHIRNEQLLSLNGFERQLDSLLDLPVEAQLAANTLYKTFKCNLTLILVNNPAEQRLVLLAASGPDAASISPNYRHSLTRGLVGRAVRSHRPLINQDSGELLSTSEIGIHLYPSQMVVPLTHSGYLEGAILLADLQEGAFDPEDMPYVEALGNRLAAAWVNDRNRQGLAELVESTASLSTTLNPQQLLERIANIARRSAHAWYGLAAIHDEDGWHTGGAGKESPFFDAIRSGLPLLFDDIYKTRSPLHIRDIRKDVRTAGLAFVTGEFRSLLATPILLDQQLTGVIVVIGKKSPAGFTEHDAFLLNLLSSHAAISIDRCMLDEKGRSTLRITELLLELSKRIAESDDLNRAAQEIARTAFRLFQPSSCGLALYTPMGQMEASVLYPADDPSVQHPEEIIKQAILTRKIVYQETEPRIIIPIQTQRRCYGALWLELGENAADNRKPVEEILILINQSAVALERSILLSETRQQANQIAQAFAQLEESYDQTLMALTNALGARHHETETHTKRVSQMALALGIAAGLNTDELKALLRGSLLHDIGKIGISDTILLKPANLDRAEWDLMRTHPAIGAEIISSIPSLGGALTVIANHHERWDGSGYPNGLKGTDIPFIARLFSVVDVFDALTSDRPYRKPISITEALEYIKAQSGVLFDPTIVIILEKIVDNLPIAENIDI